MFHLLQFSETISMKTDSQVLTDLKTGHFTVTKNALSAIKFTLMD